MNVTEDLAVLPEAVRGHLANVADNLQLLADLGYGHVALAVVDGDGALIVRDEARPSTAVTPHVISRAGKVLEREAEPEAYEALASGRAVRGDRGRSAHGVKYSTSAYPVGDGLPYAVVVRDVAQQVAAAPGRMETAQMDATEELLETLRSGPLLDAGTREPFSSTRRAGDGVLRVRPTGRISFASPNAVNIMRLAGVEGRVTGMQASALPGGAFGISPVLGAPGAVRVEAEIADRVLGYRSIALQAGALVLVEDLTETRRRELELRVKETTIREVHHRVKNNLQTIASLLRIQARGSRNEEVRRALAEATERVMSMAVVHELLTGSADERIDFAAAARTVVDLVRRGLIGERPNITTTVSGDTGELGAQAATSLALAVAELVHNAIEHAFDPGADGAVGVEMRRESADLVIVVRDDGKGLPPGFDAAGSGHLGLDIVRTVIEDDLRGALTFASDHGTTVTIRAPLHEEEL
ncbi:MAG: histidine kinase N-terminal domain-containing protein [Actinomycetes bacterium]